MKKSEVTKARLLAVGIQKFSEKGYDGATVDEIVAAARVNKRMVYHYFGSKEKLYQAVLRDVYERLANIETTFLAEPHDVEEMIQEIIRIQFAFLQEHPEFVKLVLWENLNQGRGMEGADLELTRDATIHHLDRAIQAGVAAGKLRSDLDTKHLLISLIGLCVVYFSNRYTLSRLLHLDLSSREVLSDGIRHVARLALRGILK